jgi:hypothetical protein
MTTVWKQPRITVLLREPPSPPKGMFALVDHDTAKTIPDTTHYRSSAIPGLGPAAPPLLSFEITAAMRFVAAVRHSYRQSR